MTLPITDRLPIRCRHGLRFSIRCYPLRPIPGISQIMRQLTITLIAFASLLFAVHAEPVDFIAKLAALVPKPRVNLTRL